MTNKIEIERLASGEIKPQEMMELEEDFNEIQRSLVVEQRNNREETPIVSSGIMRRSYERRG